MYYETSPPHYLEGEWDDWPEDKKPKIDWSDAPADTPVFYAK
jgi:hypothetical protein